MVATSNTYIESKIQGHLISILLLYKYSSYDYRVIFFMSKCVYIFLGHSVLSRLSNQGEWDGQGMWQIWGRGKFCAETHKRSNEPSDSVKNEEFLV